MKIALIGMSGSGKSFWSQKLAAKDFQVVCVDDLVEEKLGAELQHMGFKGIRDVAIWMGQPFDKQYKETSEKYLYLENQIMEELLTSLQHPKNAAKNIVVDTTGSVIYTHKHILPRLKEYAKLVYLETPLDIQQKMYEEFISNPKPIIWGESFSIKDGETEMEALKRCYPNLLAFRSIEYKKHADITIDYQKLRSEDFTEERFLEVIQQ